jgi:hypothetical protein
MANSIMKKQTQLAVVDPKSIVQTMEKAMPEWVKKINTKEDMGNAVYTTSQEFLMAIDDTLLRYFNFTEDDIKRFHRELEDILKGVKEFEEHGLNIMTPHSMDVIGEKIDEIGIGGLLQEIANTRLLKEKMTKAGLEYPISLQATPFIKKLKEKNR